MFRKTVSAIMLFLLVASMLTLAFKIQPVKAAAITVPNDYSTIQGAIDHASFGDTIYVRAGTYAENLEVNKPVILTGESNGSTTIMSSGIIITASNVTFKDFHVEQANGGGMFVVCIDGRDASCSFVTVRDNTIIDRFNQKCEMLDVITSEHDTISGNQIVMEGGGDSGIVLEFQANHNVVNNNTVVGGWTDLFCDFSKGDNIFSNNYVANQTLNVDLSDVGAMFIALTDRIVVKGNTFVNNAIGFSAPDGQPDVTLYHNNFINNTVQILPPSDPNMKLDNGYPSGGNYWSDYNGTDSLSGPYQNVTGKDGVGDTPYLVDAESSDNYPLMKPWFPLVGDLNGDGVISLSDLMLLADAYGSRPIDVNWNAMADIAPPYGIISLTDLVTMAIHYGQHYP